MHMVMILIFGLAIAPRFANVLIPAHRVARGDGKYEVQPQVTVGETLVLSDGGLEGGSMEEHDGIGGNTLHGRRMSEEVVTPKYVNEKS